MKISLPEQFKKLTDNQNEFYLHIPDYYTVREIIGLVNNQFNGIKDRLITYEELNKFVNIFVNQEDIRFIKGLETIVTEDDEVVIVPAVAGG